MAWRSERLAREILKQCAIILNQQEWPADRLTVASVEVSSKMDYARVYIDIWPEAAQLETIAELNRRKGLIKKELASKLKIRLMPEVGFYLDHGSEATARIADLLQQAGLD